MISCYLQEVYANMLRDITFIFFRFNEIREER